MVSRGDGVWVEEADEAADDADDADDAEEAEEADDAGVVEEEEEGSAAVTLEMGNLSLMGGELSAVMVASARFFTWCITPGKDVKGQIYLFIDFCMVQQFTQYDHDHHGSKH